MEIWRDIPGYEGRYQVSTHGRVRSLSRPVRCCGGKFRMLNGRILRPGRMNEFGHVSVMLGRDGGSRCVHDLVLTTFVGPRPAGQEARHRDLDGSNNKLDNLLWGTRFDNMRDTFSQHGKKLTIPEVHEIRRRRANGELLREIAEDYPVTISAISAVSNKRTFGYVE